MSAVENTNTSAHGIFSGFATLPQFLAARCSSNCAHPEVFLISQSSTPRLQAAHSLLVLLQGSQGCFHHPTATSLKGPGACDKHPPTHAGSSSGGVILPHFCQFSIFSIFCQPVTAVYISKAKLKAETVFISRCLVQTKGFISSCIPPKNQTCAW